MEQHMESGCGVNLKAAFMTRTYQRVNLQSCYIISHSWQNNLVAEKNIAGPFANQLEQLQSGPSHVLKEYCELVGKRILH
jgi:TPP-dependent 2-oxoacid decarboxylase